MAKKETEEYGQIQESELIGYFMNELNSEDTKRVEKWIAASDENRRLAESVYEVTLGLDILDTVANISTEQALKAVDKRIFSKKVSLLAKRAQQIAAILFVPLLISFTYLLFKNANEEPQYITFKTNPGIVADFILPDGSKVWLNAHSELKYPSAFKGNKREVQLKGEAYFQVEKDKKHPFIVQLSNNVDIEVTGTEFNVDAYEKSNEITAMLVNGEINLRYPHKTKGTVRKKVLPGQKIFFDKETEAISLATASALVETSWKDGKIYLDNTPIVHLLHTLSKRFDVDFIMDNEQLKNNYFTGAFGSQDLDMILKHLEFSSGIKHRIERQGINNINERIVITLY